MYLLKLILLLCVIQRMNIININLGSFNTSKELLKHYVQEKKAHVACLSETFELNNNVQLPGWIKFSKPRDNPQNKFPRGGVAILVNKNTKSESYDSSDLPDIEIVACQSYVANTKVLIVFVYIQDLESLCKLCRWIDRLDETKYPHVLICGDFNSHHCHWDTTYKQKTGSEGDAMGIQLFHCMWRNHLKLLNDKKPTCKSGKTVIDLAVTRGLQHLQVKSYTEQNAILSTIHNPMIIQIGTIEPWHQLRYQLSKATDDDFTNFNNHLKSIMTEWKDNIDPEHISSKEGRNLITKNFLKAFHDSIDHCFSQKKICQYSKFWMTEAIKQAIKEFKKCKRRNRKWCDPSSSQDLSEAKAHLDHLIQIETDKYWANYLRETGSTSGKNFWNKVKNVIDR